MRRVTSNRQWKKRGLIRISQPAAIRVDIHVALLVVQFRRTALANARSKQRRCEFAARRHLP